jgi:uncharacterized protein
MSPEPTSYVVAIDPDNAGFFAAAARGRLVVSVCVDCATPIHPPRDYCPSCGGGRTHLQPASGRGVLYSFTRVEHGSDPAFVVPYAIVVVALADFPAVRLMGRLHGRPELAVGDQLDVVFDDPGLGVGIPNWRVVPS